MAYTGVVSYMGVLHSEVYTPVHRILVANADAVAAARHYSP